jgi:hypothetical protein
MLRFFLFLNFGIRGCSYRAASTEIGSLELELDV